MTPVQDAIAHTRDRKNFRPFSCKQDYQQVAVNEQKILRNLQIGSTSLQSYNLHVIQAFIYFQLLFLKHSSISSSQKLEYQTGAAVTRCATHLKIAQDLLLIHSCTVDAMQLRNERFYRYIPQLMERVELSLDFPISQTSRPGVAEKRDDSIYRVNR